MNEFQKTIIFTKTPLTGYFRYSDLFQIYPADLAKMPESTFQEHYPIILEYRIKQHEIIDISIEDDELRDLRTLTATTLTKQDEILNLLTLFTNHLFFRYSDLTGTWGMPMLKDNPGKEANTWSSKWNMIMFHWPELPEQLKIDKFSDVELKYRSVEFIPFMEYYQNNPNYDYYRDKTITFPNNIFLGLDAYYSINNEKKEIIDTAISHSISAVELRNSKKTLSVISAFTSIETMVNFENRDFKPIKCEKCDQLQYKISQHYREYLLKYLGDNLNNKRKFNALYTLRSKIVHTGMTFKTEKLWNNLPKDEKHKELISQLEVILLSKMSIINWLIINNQDDRPS
jgi:hypothetical protein